MTAPELSACPFCGGEARFVHNEECDDAGEPHENFGGEWIECSKCGACTNIRFPLKDGVKDELIEHWNRRAAPQAVGGEPVAHCVWDDCDQEAIYCEGHAREYADGLHAPRESPTPIGERWNRMARAMQRIGAAGTEEEIEKILQAAYSDSSASPKRQTDETGKAGSDGAVKRGENYQRNGDMTPPGDSVLIGHIQHDGDVCLQIQNRERDDPKFFKYADIEFCASGGKSINTLHALHALVAAMAKDGAPLTRVEAAVPSPIQAERPHKDEIRSWRWHSSMDDVVPETGQRAENVPVRSPDKGGAAGNGVAAGAERRVVHPASLPLEAAPSATRSMDDPVSSSADARLQGQVHGGVAPLQGSNPCTSAPSALDVAAIVQGLRAHNLTMFEPAAAALEREHARAEKAERERDNAAIEKRNALFSLGSANATAEFSEAKVAALEAALRAADEMHKQGQRHYHGEPERRTCPMCAAMDTYRAARDAA